ncbi:aldose epimerase family protein [Sphingobacterium endophyticum]|uniref:aldose epimerase family protein n=1 Tax=Sphingobacterium endophyticum TaxID=2546448 RepID=UPI0012E24A3D|nr:aldose epimerase family protein [Sphingobacterium endophyticum]
MNKSILKLVFAGGLLAVFACQQPTKQTAENGADSAHSIVTSLDSASFSADIDGKSVKLYTLKNASGATAYLTNFGARIVGLQVPDRNGTLTDVVLGFNKASDYNNPSEPYYGPIVGPFGNRIANGKFTLDGETYTLPTNNGPNTLHGGLKGVHFANWDVKSANGKAITFAYTLPDKQEGFPGPIHMEVTYSLSDNNELSIAYQVTTDKKTVVNLTNHAYFNLNGEGSGTITEHALKLNSDKFTPVDSTLIPTGQLLDVKGTPFDFTTSKTIGQDIKQDNEQLKFGQGYDHNWVLNETKVDGLNHAGTLTGDKSGIVMDIYTSEPGIQFYSGNFMADKVTLKNGAKDSFRTALCLETQHFPDSPNQPTFPSTTLKPGDTYTSKSIYKFTTK